MAWLVILGALIGAGAAIAGQKLNDIYAARREHAERVRYLTAEMLANGRSTQGIVRSAGFRRELTPGVLDPPYVPLMRAGYELRWMVSPSLADVTANYQTTMHAFVEGWNASPAIRKRLEADMSTAANDFEDAIVDYLARRPRLWRRVPRDA